MKIYKFKKAMPVWIKGKQKEMNVTCGIHTVVTFKPDKTYMFSAATSGFYRFFVNGKFAFYGPARCAHGYYRVDRVDLTPYLKNGANHIAMEVVNYYINSYYSLYQPGFVQAEISEDETVLAATMTESGGFTSILVADRIQKVQKYSFQRAFGECYRLHAGSFVWRNGDFTNETKVELEQTEEKRLIPRELPMNNFQHVTPKIVAYRGQVRTGIKPPGYKKDRSLVNISLQQRGFKEEELEVHLSDEVQELDYYDKKKISLDYHSKTVLNTLEYEIVSFSNEKTGFIGMNIHCVQDGVLYIMVDETLTNQDVDPLSMECLNVIKLELKKGEYNFLSFEPFGFMYMKIVCISGSFELDNIHIRELSCPISIHSSYTGDNPRLAQIFEAAKETFCQNSSDIFMDCPTRERAGWLCDSFFTARAERAFTGDNKIEKAFLLNFLLADKFEYIPDGMLPMCYPADHFDGVFIPNWAMWLVIELHDYYNRTGDMAFVQSFKQKVYALLDYFRPFENEFGLLEKLEGWVFVEWSHANNLVQDVNYPSNMLYSAMLKCAGSLYQDEALMQKSNNIAGMIRQRSFDGEYFVDNEIRKDGELKLTGERTETCQYYAFFFDIVTPESHFELWNRLINEFGPERMEKKLHLDIYPSNAFIGNYLRLDILSRYGLHKQCMDEIEGYFGYMADRTGTLWENITDHASCNHGFASYVAYLIKNAELAAV